MRRPAASRFLAATLSTLALACAAAPPRRFPKDMRLSGPPIQARPATIEGRTQAPDGVSIAYRAAGAGVPTLVFVHGWSCDQDYWRDAADRLSGTHQVVTLDLAGHGRSDSKRFDWTLDAYAGDVAAVVKGLDLWDVVLVGHSLGAPVAVLAAGRLPGRVRGVVGVEAFYDLTKGFDPAFAAKFASDLEADFPTRTHDFVRQHLFAPDADPALVTRISGAMAAAPPRVAVPSMRAYLAFDTGAAVGALATAPPGPDGPVLIGTVNGLGQATDLVANRTVVPNFRLAQVPSHGHFPQVEDPETFIAALSALLVELGLEAPQPDPASRR
jgi:pimeloyl-ACP methyl ester carboxylesterase